MAKRKVHLRCDWDNYPTCVCGPGWAVTDKTSEVTCLRCKRSLLFYDAVRKEKKEEEKRYKKKYPLFIGVGMLDVHNTAHLEV